MNHNFMVAYPGCHDIIPLSVATDKKLPLFLDLTHVNPYSVKSNFRLNNLRSFSEVVESKFFVLYADLNTGYHHANIREFHIEFLAFFFLVMPSLISCFIVMFCLLVSAGMFWLY